MTLTESMTPYINKYNTVNQSPNNVEQDSGNSLLYYGDYIQILKANNEPLPTEKQFTDIIEPYYVADHQGLLNRSPVNYDHQAFDDYIGVLSAASLVSPVIARQILTYGQENQWYFDNEYPDEPVMFRHLNAKNYFGRMNGFIAHAYFANKELPTRLERIRWMIALIGNAIKRDGTSGTRLSWHLVKTYEASGLNLFFCNLAVKIWKKSFWKDFKEGMGDLFSIYFKPEHPFSVYMKGKL